MTDQGPPPTLRAFIAGISGSGKSTAAWNLYLSRYPRRILIDHTGEWASRADVVVYTVPELSWALHKYAPAGRWTISAELGIEDMPDLVDYLIPVPQLERSPIRQVGGAVLLMDEVDLVAPPLTARQEMRTLFRRSRHVGLSVVATTQRPENVSKEVSAQSHHVLCLQLVQPRAFAYMGEVMGLDLEASLRAWTHRHPHGGVWQEVRTQRVLWLEESGRLTRPAVEIPVPSVAPAGAAVAPEEEPEEEPEERHPPAV